MSVIQNILSKIGEFFIGIFDLFKELFTLSDGYGLLYTAIARWVFIILSLFILVKSIVSLLRSRSPNEVWAYFNVNDRIAYPITHWENLIGRSKSCDLVLKDGAASRSHGTLSRDAEGRWSYMDLGSSNGSICAGKRLTKGKKYPIEPGDSILIGQSTCTLLPISLEEKRNNEKLRKEETFLLSPWSSLLMLTLFQLMTVIQLDISLGESYTSQIAVAFAGLCILMWVYVISMRMLKRKSFEMETIAFFLSTLSLAVTASKFPHSVLKQFIAIVFGVLLFVGMCTVLRNLDRSKAIKKYLYAGAAAMLIFNLLLGTTKFGAANWVSIGGLSVQPSEIVKLAFIWVGAASLDELMEKRNSLIFMLFSGFCFICLALMGDFGTALIFFVSFLVISFLRSGDFTKLILIVGVAFVGGLMVLKFKAYVAARFSAWGHVWEYADEMGYQQTRTMSYASGGGLLGLGAGNGSLKTVAASNTDLVFGFVTEEWGLIISILLVLCIITLSLFAVNSIVAGRSAFYTIAACGAATMMIFQTMLNIFGAVDLFPLTGVTFPFVSTGGTSAMCSWAMLAYFKAADMRKDASLAIKRRP